MSGLDASLIETATVEGPNGKGFTVRGLNITDIMTVARTHTPELLALYNEVRNGRTDPKEPLTMEFVRGLLKKVITEFDDLLFLLVASAADEPQNAHIVRRLPVVMQMEAAERVLELTIKSEAELKKLLEVAARILGRLTSTMELVNTEISTTGSGTSESA